MHENFFAHTVFYDLLNETLRDFLRWPEVALEGVTEIFKRLVIFLLSYEFRNFFSFLCNLIKYVAIKMKI